MPAVRYVEPDTGHTVHTIVAAELVGRVMGLKSIEDVPAKSAA